MNIIIWLVQLIGWILIFTPFTILGIVLIVVTGFMFLTMEKIENASFKRDIKRRNEHNNQTNSDFKKSFNTNPFSGETEKAFNNLSYGNKRNQDFGNHALPDDLIDTTYKQRLENALDKFEKNYIAKGEDAFKDFYNIAKDLIGSAEKYKNACKYINRTPIPELIEDFIEFERFEKWSKNHDQNQLDERIEFIRGCIKSLQVDGEDRKKIEMITRSKYREKFGKDEPIELRSINGKWSAKNIHYNRKSIDIVL